MSPFNTAVEVASGKAQSERLSGLKQEVEPWRVESKHISWASKQASARERSFERKVPSSQIMFQNVWILT